MLPRLFEFAERDEEGVRNVVAECLGKLAAVAPDAVVPALEARLLGLGLGLGFGSGLGLGLALYPYP